MEREESIAEEISDVPVAGGASAHGNTVENSIPLANLSCSSSSCFSRSRSRSHTRSRSRSRSRSHSRSRSRSCSGNRSRSSSCSSVGSSCPSISDPSSADEAEDHQAEGREDSSSYSSDWRSLPRGFFCVYLLQSVSSPHHFYVGCTTNPLRRLRQHNGELQQGARRTSLHRPWRLCLFISGFPSLVGALQFEFRWQQTLVPAAALRSLCCSGDTGAVCSCSNCSSCAARRRQIAKQRRGRGQSRVRGSQSTAAAAPKTVAAAAAAAAADWELLNEQAAAADDSRCCRVPFVLRRRRSKLPQERLEAELQQALLLLHGIPFCNLPLQLHACCPDVTDTLQDLLVYPCCGGGTRKQGRSSSSGRALTRVPPQVTVSSGPAISLSLRCPGLRVGSFTKSSSSRDSSSSKSSSGCNCCFGDAAVPDLRALTSGNSSIRAAGALCPAVSAAAGAAIAGCAATGGAKTPAAATCAAAGDTCALCLSSFQDKDRALSCPQCGVYVHLTCAGRFALQQESEARKQQQLAETASKAPDGATQAAATDDDDDEHYRLVPAYWWCCSCSRRVFWGFILNHLFERRSRSPSQTEAAAAVAAAQATSTVDNETAACVGQIPYDGSVTEPSRAAVAAGAAEAAESTPSNAAAAATCQSAGDPPAKRKASQAMAGCAGAGAAAAAAVVEGAHFKRCREENASFSQKEGVPPPASLSAGASICTSNSNGERSSLLFIPPLLERLRLQSSQSQPNK